MAEERNPWTNRRHASGRPTEGSGKRSKFEEEVLEDAKAKGMLIGYEQDKLKYLSEYLPDFTLLTHSGKKIFVEAKGWFKPEDRSKILKVLRYDPSVDIRMLFMANNKINPKSPTRYSDWCEKHGIKYAFKRIPLEWAAE